MKAEVLLTSQSGKSIFVKVKKHEFDSQGIAGYCQNPEGKYKKGDIIDNFPMPTGIEQRADENGDIMKTQEGVPLSFLKWS